jgi:DNA invertase Pin-like site-specific DNA recombinase
LEKALAYLREADVLVVWRLDRLARSLKHLIEIVDDLRQRSVGFKVLTGANIDTTTSGGRLVFGIFASLAEFEREMIQERVKAGLESARAAGKHLGRPQLAEQRQVEIRGRLAAGEPWRSISRAMGVSQSTIARYAKQ